MSGAQKTKTTTAHFEQNKITKIIAAHFEWSTITKLATTVHFERSTIMRIIAAHFERSTKNEPSIMPRARCCPSASNEQDRTF